MPRYKCLKIDEDPLKALHKYSIIDPVTNCWLWKKATIWSGYGTARFHKKTVYVHRLSAHIHFGFDLSDKKLQVNHKPICKNRNCWNPDHLYIGNQSDNMRDAVDAGTFNVGKKQNKTHCPRGHEYTIENSYITKQGVKTCRECRKTNSKEWSNKVSELNQQQG